MNRPYFALTGPELLEAIIREFRKKAEASGLFPLNKTFPQVSWEFELTIDLYPSEPPQYKVITKESWLAEGHTLGELRRGSVKGGRKDVGKVIPPDKVRAEEGMKMAKPTMKQGVGVVDELVDAIQPGGGKE